MIVVDTSVWVAALRSASCDDAKTLIALLDADEVALPVPVRTELLSGASNKDRAVLKRVLSGLPVLYPTDETWKTVDDWTERAGRRGARFGLGDLLIGAITHEAGALVWSQDHDFARMERLGLLARYTS